MSNTFTKLTPDRPKKKILFLNLTKKSSSEENRFFVVEFQPETTQKSFQFMPHGLIQIVPVNLMELTQHKLSHERNKGARNFFLFFQNVDTRKKIKFQFISHFAACMSYVWTLYMLINQFHSTNTIILLLFFKAQFLFF